MAVADRPADFAIESSADSLVRRLSGKVADMVLMVASHTTTHRTTNGLPLVTDDDVVKSIHAIARVLGEAKERADLPAELKEAFRHLLELAQGLQPPAANEKGC